MDRSVHDPDPGSGAGAFAPAAVCLSPEKAEEFFENFRKGKFTVVMLGDVERQAMHWIKTSERDQEKGIYGHMDLCTASFGSCHWCRARLAGNVLIQKPQSYRMGPALVRTGGRGDFEQKVAVFTHGMWEELAELLGPTGWRGHRFDLARRSSQDYTFTLAKRSHTLTQKLPPAFAILPFVRARFELPQNPAEPVVILPAYSNRELTPSRAEPEGSPDLALTAADLHTAEEQAKIREKKKALRERFGIKSEEPPAETEAERLERERNVLKMVREAKNYAPPEPVVASMVPPAEKAVAAAEARMTATEEAGDPELARAVKRTAAVKKKAAEARGDDNAVSLGGEFDDIIPAAKTGGVR